MLPSFVEEIPYEASLSGACSRGASWAPPPERTFYGWKAGKARRVPEDTLRRICYVAGIYKALQILYSRSLRQADRLGALAGTGFSATSKPLERMAAVDVSDLAGGERAYLDAARAPWS